MNGIEKVVERINEILLQYKGASISGEHSEYNKAKISAYNNCLMLIETYCVK